MLSTTISKILTVRTTDLVSRWFKLDSWTRSYNNKCMQEMRLYARRTERCVVSLKEDYAYDVVANVTFSLKLK